MSHETSTMISSKLLKEANLTYLFIKSDVLAVIVPGTLTLLASWISSDMSLTVLPLYFLCSLSFCLLFLYTVCLSNQVLSIAEDRKNKPWRPLPSNLVTTEGVHGRLIFANILFLLLSYYLHVFHFAVLWQFVTFLCHNGGLHAQLVGKNLVFMTLGVFILFCSQWQIIQPLDSLVYQYAVALSIWSGLAFHLQDMRDQEGDQLIGRKTLPLAIGDKKARIVLTLFFLILSPLLIFLLFSTQINAQQLLEDRILSILFVLIVLFNWLIAYRIWNFKTARGDHRTYMLLLYLFSLLMFLIGVIRWYERY